jgi:hypothetical protein
MIPLKKSSDKSNTSSNIIFGYLNAFIFVFLFISPHSVSSVIPEGITRPYLNLIVLLIIVLGFLINKNKLKTRYMYPLALSGVILIFGVLNIPIHGIIKPLNLISPILTLIGYLYLQERNFRVEFFVFYIIGWYIFYYFIYYSVLPDLFFRPGFDEDELFFDNSSSNAIPICLNMSVYAFFICNKFFNQNANRLILAVAIINVLLIVIQQSRSGIVISIVLMLMILWEYKRSLFFMLSSLVLIPILIYYKQLVWYFEVVGNIDASALETDGRTYAQKEFFETLDLWSFIFGHTERIYGRSDFSYTYNVFLDFWDDYGFIPLFFLMAIFLLRAIFRKKFKFPLYYFIPFFMYTMVESIFLPMFWDVLIYVLIFTPKDKISIGKA